LPGQLVCDPNLLWIQLVWFSSRNTSHAENKKRNGIPLRRPSVASGKRNPVFLNFFAMVKETSCRDQAEIVQGANISSTSEVMGSMQPDELWSPCQLLRSLQARSKSHGSLLGTQGAPALQIQGNSHPLKWAGSPWARQWITTATIFCRKESCPAAF